MDNIDTIIAYENGELSFDKKILMFQSAINSGQAWMFQGSYGRAANDLLEQGLCLLGHEAHRDYWGNRIPARHEVVNGTKGSPKFVKAALKRARDAGMDVPSFKELSELDKPTSASPHAG